MSRPKYASDIHTLALVAGHGTDQQRALRTVPSDRADLLEAAVQRARRDLGDSEPLVWLNHQTSEITPA